MINEFTYPLEIEKTGCVSALMKLSKVGWYGFSCHHPKDTSLAGRVAVLKTPRNGIIQMRATPQARRCTTMVRIRILRHLAFTSSPSRSEERRVGKEWSSC